jgi:hypothetical protein
VLARQRAAITEAERIGAWYARGEAVLYGETRDYVKKVLARLNARR